MMMFFKCVCPVVSTKWLAKRDGGWYNGGMDKETTGKHRLYSQAGTGLFVLLVLLMFVAYLYSVTEAMGAFYFGLLIIHRVIMGLVIKRRFWHWADEKVSFYSLLTAFALSAAFLALLVANSPAEAAAHP